MEVSLLLWIALVFFAAVLAFALLRIQMAWELSQSVKKMLRQSGHHNGRAFHREDSAGLPEPVQRYFNHVLTDGQLYINRVRLKHQGTMKTGLDKSWTKITAEEYFTTANPGMIWVGRTNWFKAIDRFVDGNGSLIVKLFGIFKVVNVQDETVTQAELLRWLGESVWFPTNLLPSEYLQWTPIDYFTARLDFNFGNCRVWYTVEFNKNGEIIQLETQRYRNAKNLDTWIGKLSCYKRRHKMLIPTVIEASWRLNDLDYPYARFRLTHIDYGNRKPL
jgi:hypothetical protein